MREKLKYLVTETAPTEVAGRRVKAGDILELTEPVARYEVLQGFLKPFEEPSKEPAEVPAKRPAKSKPAAGAAD